MLTLHQQLRGLSDVWQSQPNNPFAERLFKRNDWAHAGSSDTDSRLCELCARFDLSDPRFQMSEHIDAIRSRAQICELCGLFSQVAEELLISSGQTFRCFRHKSTLCSGDGSQPVMSIYADSGNHLLRGVI